MGLDLEVGGLALAVAEGDEDVRRAYVEKFAVLNEFLRGRGHAHHEEPTTLPKGSYFGAQMWGYSGLHSIRRMAACHAIRGGLPPVSPDTMEDSQDPIISSYYSKFAAYERKPAKNWWSRLIAGRPPSPPFAHLMWHSDAEGYYLPRTMDAVLFDLSRDGIVAFGGMVGSSVHLLQECSTLAKLINLPLDKDPEDEEFFLNVDTPATEGELWRVHGVEAFGLSRLIKACSLSIEHGAAVVFT
jgi:hypothetical protein